MGETNRTETRASGGFTTHILFRAWEVGYHLLHLRNLFLGKLTPTRVRLQTGQLQPQGLYLFAELPNDLLIHVLPRGKSTKQAIATEGAVQRTLTLAPMLTHTGTHTCAHGGS